MADARFCVGFSKACKQAREGGGLPGYGGRASCGRALRPFLPPDIVRLIDALVRRLEHEDTLLAMNGGVLDATLCQASGAGGLRDVRFLLARGADVESTTIFLYEGQRLSMSALEWSAFHGHLAVVTALLDAGAVQKDLALAVASLAARAPVVALLLDCGADIHYHADVALYISCWKGHVAIATLLLDRGADMHAQGDLALGTAVLNGHLEVVRLLLDRGMDVHTKDDRALQGAAEFGHFAIAVLLLDRGANVHADNEYALRAARRNGHAAVVALLLERGALEPQA